MDFKISFLTAEQAVVAKLEQRLSAATTCELFRELIQHTREHGCSRILIDERQCNSEMTMLEIYELPQSLDQLGFERGNNTAIVYSGNEDLFGFLETVTANQGFLIRTFKDYDKAWAWLLQQ